MDYRVTFHFPHFKLSTECKESDYYALNKAYKKGHKFILGSGERIYDIDLSRVLFILYEFIK